jgi:hypothetical protein
VASGRPAPSVGRARTNQQRFLTGVRPATRARRSHACTPSGVPSQTISLEEIERRLDLAPYRRVVAQVLLRPQPRGVLAFALASDSLGARRVGLVLLRRIVQMAHLVSERNNDLSR